MGKKKRNGRDKQLIELAFVTAILALLTQVLKLVATIIEWIANR